MIKEVKIATAVIETNGKYLLLRRSRTNRTNKGKWQFPEGKLELDETPEQAVRRELKEETNLDMAAAKFRKSHSVTVYYPKFGKVSLLRAIFDCKTKGNIKLSEEHDKFCWFSKDEIKKLRIVNNIGKTL